MERSIVRAFKRLRVLTPNFKFRGTMDDLVNDLSHALEETSNCHARSGMKLRRRRGRKRRSKHANGLGLCGGAGETSSRHRPCFISEDSESSLDFSSVSHQYYSHDRELMGMDHEKMHQSTLSDTDDLNIIQRFRQTIKIPNDGENMNLRKPSSGMSFESDSVNENFSPVRPHRRRRKFKRMDTDCHPIDEKLANPLAFATPQADIPLANNPFSSVPNSDKSHEVLMLTCGKRKRSSRERSLEMLEDCKNDGSEHVNLDHVTAASTCPMMSNESSISSVSSSESDTDLLRLEDAREADDEQSDFYFESGPSSGIPGVKSWWDKTDDSDDSDAKIGQVLQGCLDHLTPSAQNSYGLQRIQNMQKRDIRTGHRRLDTPSKRRSKVASIDDIIDEFINDPNQNELWLPPLSKKEKEQLLVLASTYMLKIKCEGHGAKKRAFLMKTSPIADKMRIAVENSSNVQNNNVALNDIKRRKKTPAEIVGQGLVPMSENATSKPGGSWEQSVTGPLDNKSLSTQQSSFVWPKFQALGHSTAAADTPMYS